MKVPRAKNNNNNNNNNNLVRDNQLICCGLDFFSSVLFRIHIVGELDFSTIAFFFFYYRDVEYCHELLFFLTK